MNNTQTRSKSRKIEERKRRKEKEEKDYVQGKKRNLRFLERRENIFLKVVGGFVFCAKEGNGKYLRSETENTCIQSLES
jgi:hypothetical protein